MSKETSAEKIKRFLVPQRILHFVIVLVTLLLGITGFSITLLREGGLYYPLYYQTLVLPFHKWMGVAIFGIAYYYIVFNLSRYSVNPSFVKEMLPSFRDVREFFKFLVVGLRLEKTDFGKKMLEAVGAETVLPRHSKYHFIEKFDFWGAIIGYPILMVTGIVLAFPEWGATVMSYSWIIAFHIIHAVDAVLVLAVLLLHFHNVHTSERNFPMRMTIFTGRVNKEDAREEYPRWNISDKKTYEGQDKKSDGSNLLRPFIETPLIIVPLIGLSICSIGWWLGFPLKIIEVVSIIIGVATLCIFLVALIYGAAVALKKR